MKMYLRTILSFVFVAYSHAQGGYQGRTRGDVGLQPGFGGQIGIGSPIFANPLQHDIGKAQAVGGQLRHDTAKAVAVGEQLQHDTAKANIGGGLKPGFGIGNLGPFGGVSAGTVGVDHPSVIAHNIGKATLGADAVQGHNIAKAAQVPVGTGFINPNGHVAGKIEGEVIHDIAKSSSFGGPMIGGGMIPHDISSVLGSTILGRPLTAGEMIGNVLLPRHGGTLNPDGIANGFGAVMPNGPFNLNDGWADPLRGLPFPSDFNGQELVFDPISNRYVIAPGSVGHQVAKGGMGGGNPIQHNIVKSMDDDYNRQSGNVFVGGGNPVQHDMAKVSMGGVYPIPAGKPPIFNNGMTNLGPFGGVSAGTVGVDHPSVIAHNIGKATLGADAVQGHNIAKAAQVPVGTGFINPNGHVAGKIEGEVIHDIAKSSSFGGPMVGAGVMGVHQPGMVGVTPFGGMHRPGMPMGVNIVHDVNKVGASGMAAIGHDPLAASLGHGLAKGSIGDAARIIDRNTGGAVSMGNPFANAAAGNLASESLHVAQKTIGLTSGGQPVKAPSDYTGRKRD